MEHQRSRQLEDYFSQRQSWNFWKDRIGVPYFSNHTQTRVLATLGRTSYLHCLVGNLGDRQVSWVCKGCFFRNCDFSNICSTFFLHKVVKERETKKNYVSQQESYSALISLTLNIS